MKSRLLPILFTALAALCVASPRLIAQGALIPSGPPGPTMKTLAQVEPRTPLIAGSPGVDVAASGTITINASGSYYLTGPIVKTGNNNTIIIAANQVTLDLGGFTISSEGSPFGSGIRINDSASGISIKNGTIRGNGFANGIAFGSHVAGQPYPSLIKVSEVVVDAVAQDGIAISADDLSEVTSSVVRNAGRNGILANTVRNSSSVGAGQTAIGGSTIIACKGVGGLSGILGTVVSDSQGTSLGSSKGIEATVVTNSIGVSESGYGILAENVSNCKGTSNNPSGSAIAGIKAIGTVQNSSGHCGGDGIPIQAQIAIGCTYSGISLPQIGNRYNMP